MKRVLACALLVLTPATSRADGDDVTLFVRTGVGIGRVRSRNSRAPAVAPSVLDSFAYTGSSLELTVGAQYRRVTVGATILEHVVELDKEWKATYPLTGDFTITLFTVGPSLEWHRDRRGGPWLGGTVGLSQLSFGGARDPFGFGAAAQGGWDFATSGDDQTGGSAVGVGARITYASLDAEAYGGSRQSVFSPMLLFTWSRR